MRSVAIHTGPPSYLDHLGVLASLLDIPLIVTEENTLKAAKTFYPMINCSWMDLRELSLDFLASQFDVIYMSSHQWSWELLPLIELLYGKKMRMVYCPHGNSDKGHSQTDHFRKDIVLAYGSHMIDLLTQTGATKQITQLVTVGNFRYAFYQKNAPFYHQLLNDRWKKRRPTLLYAPTWDDGENPTSFFKLCFSLVESTLPYFDLVIKLHPFLEEQNPSQTWEIIEKLSTVPGVHFLNDFPSIYPILNNCDGYIGDASSIGYDFLAFDRPLFFLTEGRGPIRECGQTIPLGSSIGDFIQAHWNDSKNELRKKVYNYAFEGNFQLEEIEKALRKTRASWIYS